MDTGPILAQTITRIEAGDITPVLEDRLARAGAQLLASVLPCYLAGAAEPVAQDEGLATYAPIIKKTDGLIDWSRPAPAIWRASRAYQPWPATYTYWEGRILKIVSCWPEADQSGVLAKPGTVLALQGGKGAAVATGDGALRLDEVALEGGHTMAVREFLAGHHSFIGSSLGWRPGMP